jgi:hypothetical protein
LEDGNIFAVLQDSKYSQEHHPVHFDDILLEVDEEVSQ